MTLWYAPGLRLLLFSPYVILTRPAKMTKIHLVRIIFWTGQRHGLKPLRPNNKSSSNTAFGEITRNTPLLREGVLGAKENSSNVLQRSTKSLYPRSREYLTGGYTSYDFVTVGHTCVLQRLCIHPLL